MTKAEIFSKRLREAMRVRGVKQVELAKMIDTKPATVSRYLSGKRFPTLPTLCNIAIALNVSSEFLLGERTPPCLIEFYCLVNWGMKISCETWPCEDGCLDAARVFKEET